MINPCYETQSIVIAFKVPVTGVKSFTLHNRIAVRPASTSHAPDTYWY